ncbi:MAG: D-aminoacylase [Candidatus Moranbacteria bacterium]|nr:D-aminoacylase [Candidatus Moranbacteria bacterium]
MYDVIIKNGTVIDGAGGRMFRADVGVKEEMITFIGDLHDESAKRVIDATDRYVAPGFIDVNNHSDTYWQIFSNPHLESLVYQGITTIVGGNCGSSLAPLVNASMLQSIQKWADIRKINLNWLSMKEFLTHIEQHALSVNFATLSGHGTLRRGLIKDEARPLRSDELASMSVMLKRSLRDGSYGCSLGLEYTHARHASANELAALGELVEKEDGVYTVHLRDESAHLLESIQEALAIARTTGCRLHLSHLKAVGEEHWHLMEQALYLIESAQSGGVDVTFDVYPYVVTGTVLYTLLPEWVTEGGKRMMLERLKDPEIKNEVVIELREKKRDYSKIVILTSPLNQILVHQSIAAIAKNQNMSPEEALISVLIGSGGRAVASMEVVSEENIEKAIQHPFSIISTNGSGYSTDYQSTGERVHPRSFGTFPLVLSHHVRQKKLLSWEEAIHKMSGKPAKKFGLKDRGILRKGNYADIVVFHPSHIASPATSENPYQYARGMEWVLINGEVSIDNGVYTGKRSGEVLRKTSSWF